MAQLTEYGRLKRAVEESEKVVWLLGAGFSKPLGGPLFKDLLTENTARWVLAWARWKRLWEEDTKETRTIRQQLHDIPRLYRNGLDQGVWEDPEGCISLMHEACNDPVSRAVVEEVTSVSDGGIEQRRRSLSHFVAIATSYFVDRVRDGESLPEAWHPYESWWKSLNQNDAIVSFNYDRVAEELQRRHPGPDIQVHKLHGTVPLELTEVIRRNKPVDEIGMPGPSKTEASRGVFETAWNQAEMALQKAHRVVVVGYSFPPGDSIARAFVIRNLKRLDPTSVNIVLGTDSAASAAEIMFKRLGVSYVHNTNLLAQQYLVEGTADPDRLRFAHAD